MESKVIYFTQKLNKLRVKEAMFKSNGYEVPDYIKKDMRLIEIALKSLKK